MGFKGKEVHSWKTQNKEVYLKESLCGHPVSKALCEYSLVKAKYGK